MYNQETQSIAAPEVEALLEQLRREARRDWTYAFVQRYMRRLGFFGWLNFMTLMLAVSFDWHLPLPHWYLKFMARSGLLMIFLLLPVDWALDAFVWKRNRRLRPLLARLSGDVRAAGPLALLLHEHQESEIKELVKAALKQLLPRLQASDARYITPEQMKALLALLEKPALPLFNNPWDKSLAIAVMRALEQIGDHRALELVERIANRRRHTRLLQAARECLPFLQERIAEQEKSRTLLRPSDANSTIQEALLRPAVAEVRPEAQEQLLRPVE